MNRIWNWFVKTRLGKSIFRVGYPKSTKDQSEAMTSSFLLHIQPAKVHKHALKWNYSFGLGLITLYLFLILIGTGILLMFYYIPSVKDAYNSMKDLQFIVSFGIVLRNLHRWAANLMVVFVILHLCRVFYTGAYKSPREFNWVLGVFLLLVTFFLSFTGYLLPWDQLAFWAITVGTNIAGYAPILGSKIRYLLLGDDMVRQSALLRFYVLHVVVLPAVALVLVFIHIWRVRKDGGLSRPSAKSPIKSETLNTQPGKTYALMALVNGETPATIQEPEEEVFSWPQLIFREIVLFLAVLAGLLILSIFFNAPLEEIANPAHPTNPAKAPWYFLGLQELVSHSALWGGVIVPTVIVLLLVFLPYIDRKPVGIGQWFSKERWLANTVFSILFITAVILTIIGTFFRGPNWSWVWPWK